MTAEQRHDDYDGGQRSSYRVSIELDLDERAAIRFLIDRYATETAHNLIQPKDYSSVDYEELREKFVGLDWIDGDAGWGLSYSPPE